MQTQERILSYRWMQVLRTPCHVPWTMEQPLTGQGRRSQRNPNTTGSGPCLFPSAKPRTRQCLRLLSTTPHSIFPETRTTTVCSRYSFADLTSHGVFPERVAKIRELLKPQTLQRASAAAEYIQRRYSFLYASLFPPSRPLNPLRIARWNADQDLTVRLPFSLLHRK